MKEKTMDLNEIPVFPPADIFPMLGEEELTQLADDIEVHGLREPG